MTHDEGMTTPDYEREWREAEAAKEAGRFDEALERYRASLAVAERLGDEELVDRAFCNCAALSLAIGRGDDPVPRLCTILLRSPSQVNGFLAANTIARACEWRRDNKKGLFYARIALERAKALERPEWIAAASNQIGNFLLGESYFENAVQSYREALALLPSDDGQRQLTYLANLGYCELVLGQFQSAMRVLYRCLRVARNRGWQRLQMVAHTDLCYGHLELGRYDDAERHGRRGLALAESNGEGEWIKNSLYLLGEVAVLTGADQRAWAWFHELQHRFYPSQSHLPDLLISVDIRRMINLRA